MLAFSKIFILSISLFCSFTLTAQKKLFKYLDTTLVAQNKYLVDYNYESLKSSGITNELINPTNFDEDLLAALLFYEINEWRTNKRKNPFKQHSKLERMAHSYISYNKWFKFKNDPKYSARLKRFLNKTPKYFPLDFSFRVGFVDLEPLVDHVRGELYYNDELMTSPVNLYHGTFKDDEDFIEKPVELISYSDFAKRCMKKYEKGTSGKYLRSKAYELMAVKVYPINKNSNKKLMPRAKIICLIGGFQNKYILEELEAETK